MSAEAAGGVLGTHLGHACWKTLACTAAGWGRGTTGPGARAKTRTSAQIRSGATTPACRWGAAPGSGGRRCWWWRACRRGTSAQRSGRSAKRWGAPPLTCNGRGGGGGGGGGLPSVHERSGSRTGGRAGGRAALLYVPKVHVAVGERCCCEVVDLDEAEHLVGAVEAEHNAEVGQPHDRIPLQRQLYRAKNAAKVRAETRARVRAEPGVRPGPGRGQGTLGQGAGRAWA